MIHLIRKNLGALFIGLVAIIFSPSAESAGPRQQRKPSPKPEIQNYGDQTVIKRFTNYSGFRGCDGDEKDESAKDGKAHPPSKHTWDDANGNDRWAMLAVDPMMWNQLKDCTGTYQGRKVKVWDKCGACNGKGLARIDVSRTCAGMKSQELKPGAIVWDQSEKCHMNQKQRNAEAIPHENNCKKYPNGSTLCDVEDEAESADLDEDGNSEGARLPSSRAPKPRPSELSIDQTIKQCQDSGGVWDFKNSECTIQEVE